MSSSNQRWSSPGNQYPLPDTTINGELQVNGNITATGTITGTIVVVSYNNQFSVCANLSNTTTVDETMTIVTGDGVGNSYSAAGEGSWVYIGGDALTGACSVGYASAVTPNVNNTFNGDATNASTTIFNADGSYDPLLGSWVCGITGTYKVTSNINIMRISGTGERSYYHRYTVDGTPTPGCSTVTDIGGSNFYNTMTNVQIINITAGQVLRQQIAQTNTGGATVNEMRLTYNLTIELT